MGQKYSSIVDSIKKEISLGNIAPGEKMPSIRELCDSFGCSKATAVRAYYALKEQDIIYAVPQSGYYLIEKNVSNYGNNKVADFSGAALDINLLPYREFQSCLNQAINKYKENLFAYTNPQGYFPIGKIYLSRQDHSKQSIFYAR